MVNGIWGLLSVGLFASPRRIMQTYGRSDHVGFFMSFSHKGADGILLLTQIIGIFFILAWITVTMFPFFIWLDWKGWFRSDPLEELVGLDISYHGGCAMGKDVQPEYITARTLGSLESRQHQFPSSVCISETLPIPEYDIAPWENTPPM
jgi:ammonia channel protein AmtB